MSCPPKLTELLYAYDHQSLRPLSCLTVALSGQSKGGSRGTWLHCIPPPPMFSLYIVPHLLVKWFHQMSDFKAKMHQIRFPLGLRHGPYCTLQNLQSSPRPPIAVTISNHWSRCTENLYSAAEILN